MIWPDIFFCILFLYIIIYIYIYSEIYICIRKEDKYMIYIYELKKNDSRHNENDDENKIAISTA